jgi:hypothetical protein
LELDLNNVMIRPLSKIRKSFGLLLFAWLVMHYDIVLANPEHQYTEDVRIDRMAERYVKLALKIGDHDPLYVDSYFGPAEWSEAASRTGMPMENLVKDAQILLDDISSVPVESLTPINRRRAQFLAKQITAAITRLQILQGRQLTFDEESSLIFDVKIPDIDPKSFDRTLSMLKETLPGEGSLPERFSRFRKSISIPDHKLPQVFAVAVETCKSRTTQFLALAENETFETSIVHDKPWTAYHHYWGDGKSLIELNIDHTWSIDSVVELACHEAYPGHHVFLLLQDYILHKKRRWVEYSIAPLFAPQNVISEGTADYGRFMVFRTINEQIDFEVEVLFPIAGISSEHAETYRKIMRLLKNLKYARVEAARRYLDGKMDRADTIDWLTKYSLLDKPKAKQDILFFDTYRSYVVTYVAGMDLVSQYVDAVSEGSQGLRWEAFEYLLTNPMYPSLLKNEISKYHFQGIESQ